MNNDNLILKLVKSFKILFRVTSEYNLEIDKIVNRTKTKARSLEASKYEMNDRD